MGEGGIEMLDAERICSCLQAEDYHISLPLLVQVSEGEVELKSNLRLLGTLIRYNIAEVTHVSECESVVAISSENNRIGFFWKSMPKGFLLLRDIQYLDGIKEAKCNVKIISFSKFRKGEAA
jgi:hypothetical protein